MTVHFYRHKNLFFFWGGGPNKTKTNTFQEKILPDSDPWRRLVDSLGSMAYSTDLNFLAFKVPSLWANCLLFNDLCQNFFSKNQNNVVLSDLFFSMKSFTGATLIGSIFQSKRTQHYCLNKKKNDRERFNSSCCGGPFGCRLLQICGANCKTQYDAPGWPRGELVMLYVTVQALG